MIRREVVYAPEALTDLIALYDWIADATSPQVAAVYLGRLQAYLDGFDLASERGTPRSDVRPGLRTVGFEQRVTVAFAVSDDQVRILRLFYGGVNWSDAF